MVHVRSENIPNMNKNNMSALSGIETQLLANKKKHKGKLKPLTTSVNPDTPKPSFHVEIIDAEKVGPELEFYETSLSLSLHIRSSQRDSNSMFQVR